MTDEDHVTNLLDNTVPNIQEALKHLDDPDKVQSLIEAEQDGQGRAGVLKALEKQADKLASGPGSSEDDDQPPVTGAVDLDGYWAEIMQGDPSMIRRRIHECTNLHDLQILEKLETAGRKRAAVFMVLEKHKRDLQPKKVKQGKVRPPVWLDPDSDDSKVHHLKDVRLCGPLKVYPGEGFAAQLYEAELPGHTGVYKAHISLVTGLPIGGTMGNYLARIYAKDPTE